MTVSEINLVLRPVVELIDNLLGPTAKEIGEIGGDFARLWRLRNLARLAPKVRRCMEELGVDDRRYLSPAVGLPMLEAASYHDDSYLQDRWAYLIANTVATAGDETEFDLAPTFVEIMRQLSRPDCELLEFVAENGVEGINEDGSYRAKNIDVAELPERFDKRITHMSVEKLVTLGVVQRVTRMPITGGRTLSGFAEDIVPTIIGLNFYVAAAGKMPGWFPSDRR